MEAYTCRKPVELIASELGGWGTEMWRGSLYLSGYQQKYTQREFNGRMSYKGVDGDKHPTKGWWCVHPWTSYRGKVITMPGSQGTRGNNAYLNQRERGRRAVGIEEATDFQPTAQQRRCWGLNRDPDCILLLSSYLLPVQTPSASQGGQRNAVSAPSQKEPLEGGGR